MPFIFSMNRAELFIGGAHQGLILDMDTCCQAAICWFEASL
jgi:hypothetical protein